VSYKSFANQLPYQSPEQPQTSTQEETQPRLNPPRAIHPQMMTARVMKGLDERHHSRYDVSNFHLHALGRLTREWPSEIMWASQVSRYFAKGATVNNFGTSNEVFPGIHQIGPAVTHSQESRFINPYYKAS